MIITEETTLAELRQMKQDCLRYYEQCNCVTLCPCYTYIEECGHNCRFSWEERPMTWKLPNTVEHVKS